MMNVEIRHSGTDIDTCLAPQSLPDDTGQYEMQIVFYGLQFLAMPAGMGAKVLFDALHGNNAVNYVALLIAIVVSPLVFNTLLSNIPYDPERMSVKEWIVCFCLSFQNGFFWHQVLSNNPPGH